MFFDTRKISNELEELFNLAEQLFAEGKMKEALYIYKSIVKSDLSILPNAVATANYRIFVLSLGDNAEENWNVTQRFVPFIKMLPDDIQLDALLKVARMCLTLRKYSELGIYADELRIRTSYVYLTILKYKDSLFKEDKPLAIKFPLVVYYGQGFLLKERSLCLLGKYSEAQKYTKGYADLGWFEIMDDAARKEVEKFRTFAKGNTLAIELYRGNAQVLDNFVDLFTSDQYKPNLLAGLLTLVEAANMHQYNIDHILERWYNEIEPYQYSDNPVWQSQFYTCCYHRAVYECNKGRFRTGIDELLRCFSHASNSQHEPDFEKCAKLYWRYRAEATAEQDETFSKIMEGVVV